VWWSWPALRDLSPKPFVGQIRIIGGRWKRTPIPVPEGKQLRPTPDRVRETVFNWLGQHLHQWRCLDLFAGSGALSFEAASRGAAYVVAIDRDPASVAAMQALCNKLNAHDCLRIERAQAQEWLARNRETFDLIFMDPPFGQGVLAAVLPRAVEALAPTGRLYLEAEQACSPDWLEKFGLTLLRADKAGAVHYHLCSKTVQPNSAQGEHDVKSGLSGNV
jgi:16S rRNA (guanine966-N2)-methyltransferase